MMLSMILSVELHLKDDNHSCGLCRAKRASAGVGSLMQGATRMRAHSVKQTQSGRSATRTPVCVLLCD